jgi:hypothetical protein
MNSTRTIHSVLGWGLLAAYLLQGSVGLVKWNRWLNDEPKMYTWHGIMGKILYFLGCLQVALALIFFPFEAWVKVSTGIGITLSAGLYILLPRAETSIEQDDVNDPEMINLTGRAHEE